MAEEKKRILVAEDEKPMAKILSMKLERSGFDVTTVNNGEEAANELTSNPFDLVLLDLIMPKKDGFQVLEELRDKNISVPVIVTSNLSKEMEVAQAKEMGAIDYLVKTNVNLSEIVARINAFFDEQSS
jgi:DNA-binding response OmpR family regulator